MSMIIDGTNGLTFNDSSTQASAGKVLQVVSTTKTDVFSTTSTSFVDVTGISVSITPTSATSKILVIVQMQASQGSSSDSIYRLLRGATVIAVSTSGSSKNGFGQVSSSYANSMFTIGVTFLDSPTTTSATTYKVQCVVDGGTTYVNRRGAAADYGGSSTITVMEIAA